MTTFIPLNIIVVALFFGVFAIAANMLSFVMIGKINERVPEAERISYLRWGTEVRKRYKELYPTSKLPLLVNVCVVMMLVGSVFVIRFWVFGNAATGK
jgi:uncharacterized membrane protein